MPTVCQCDSWENKIICLGIFDKTKGGGGQYKENLRDKQQGKLAKIYITVIIHTVADIKRYLNY